VSKRLVEYDPPLADITKVPAQETNSYPGYLWVLHVDQAATRVSTNLAEARKRITGTV
jgi:hypothetical protein